MAQAQDARQEIVNKVLKKYLEDIAILQTLQELEQPSKVMMQRICDIIKPGYLVEFSINGIKQ